MPRTGFQRAYFDLRQRTKVVAKQVHKSVHENQLNQAVFCAKVDNFA